MEKEKYLVVKIENDTSNLGATESYKIYDDYSLAYIEYLEYINEKVDEYVYDLNANEAENYKSNLRYDVHQYEKQILVSCYDEDYEWGVYIAKAIEETKTEQNIPYDVITLEKRSSLGAILTVQELLDMWWNSVRIRWVDENVPTALCYKDINGTYSIDDYEHNPQDVDVLHMKVQVEDHFDYDADGYPIIYVDELI